MLLYAFPSQQPAPSSRLGCALESGQIMNSKADPISQVELPVATGNIQRCTYAHSYTDTHASAHQYHSNISASHEDKNAHVVTYDLDSHTQYLSTVSHVQKLSVLSYVSRIKLVKQDAEQTLVAISS
jgi:hypothetical protein